MGIAAGLDPGLGVLHAEDAARSFMRGPIGSTGRNPHVATLRNEARSSVVLGVISHSGVRLEFRHQFE
jgi:hypothetical protein